MIKSSSYEEASYIRQVSKVYAQETKERLKCVPLRTLVVSTDITYTAERNSRIK